VESTRAFGHQPLAGRELAAARALVDLHLAAGELADDEVLLAVAIDVVPGRARVARLLGADVGIARLQPHRRLELRTRGCCQQQWQQREVHHGW
jgi:hypothetical protein